MKYFKILLVAILCIVGFYTVRAIMMEGLAQSVIVYFTDFKYGWRAQTNSDFLCFLFLIAVWIVYREKSMARGLLLGYVEFMTGNLFLTVYLLYLAVSTKGNVAKMLLGKHYDERK